MNQRQNSENTPPKRALALKRWVVIGAVVLAAATVAAVWLVTRGSSQSSIAGRPVPAPAGAPVPAPSGGPSSGTTPRPGEIVITLSADKFENAQIKTEVVTEQAGMPAADAAGIRTAGTVQSNAYKEVPVFPIAGGVVRQINVELGNRVTRGQMLATIFSSELADAEAAYLKMAAEAEEHHQHHRRTTELVEIGAVSREELEQATSKYKTAEANLAAERERLILLGMSEKQVDDLRKTRKFPKPLVAVESPASGTLIARAVNANEVVMQGKEMFRVADLSTVWVIGQIYEKDFQAVNVGTPAVITTPAYPDKVLHGRVSYIDPRVDPQTRTGQVRIELANPREILKLGMFVDVNFGGAIEGAAVAQAVTAVPRSAVQVIGAKKVLFVATDRSGEFVQREVSIGPEINGMLPVYSGVSTGERVVTEGSFLLRAESLKLNPGQSMSPAHAQNSGAPLSEQPQREDRAKEVEAGVQVATVTVTENGYEPDTIKLKVGTLARVTFVRATEATCGTAVVIPEFKIKRDLPLKEPVVIDFTPGKRGVFNFTCGMGMLQGKIIVQ
ncbi:MAG: efflux RND transporter periplasmic adaptor subunit [Acidobacteriota bacterium]